MLRRTISFGRDQLPLFHAAAPVLARADRAWLERLITRHVPLDDSAAVFEKGGDDIKAVVEF